MIRWHNIGDEMDCVRHISFSNHTPIEDVHAYASALSRLALSEKLSDCQRFSEEGGEVSTAKVLLLFLEGGDEVRHEVKRIFSWQQRRPKTAFLVLQLASDDPAVVLGAIDLLGVLGEASSIFELDARFNPEETEIARHIVIALGQMGEPLAFKTILRALKAQDRRVVLEALRQLSRQTSIISWKAFCPLLRSEDTEVRTEAAFAISIRKVRKSGARLLKTLFLERDVVARRKLIRCLGSVPNRALVMPLLGIIVGDRDQKSRLEASRALDRLQGMLPSDTLYRRRKTRDPSMQAEVLFRLGKFGSTVVKHKDYLRRILQESSDLSVVQACILALGHISDRGDADLLIGCIKKDPVIAYVAAIALTKIFRMEDADRVLEVLRFHPLSIVQQIFLRYIGRRRGFGASPQVLLSAVQSCLAGKPNINTSYLAYGVLAYAPSEETMDFLLAAEGGDFEREAIDDAIGRITEKHGGIVLSVLHRGDFPVWRSLLPHLPGRLGDRWYRPFARAFFDRYRTRHADAEVNDLLAEIVRRFITFPEFLRGYLIMAPDAPWKELLLRLIMEHAQQEIISVLRGELLDLLGDEAPEVRALAMMLLLSLRDATVVAPLIEIAESDPRDELRRAARQIATALVKEGVV